MAVGTVSTAASELVAAGAVISQTPGACTACALPGDAIDLWVSTGSGLSVSTASLPSGRVNDFYLHTLSAEGGTPPYSWEMIDGALPPGVSLNSSGMLSGTPSSQVGSPYVFTVQVTDALSHSSMRQLSLVVAACDCNTGGGCH
jgi:hypothetical protein